MDVYDRMRWVALAACLAAGGCYDGSATAGGGGSDGADDGVGTGAEGDGDDSDDQSALDGLDEELDPGRVTLHRLNRVEYNNTVRDLFYGMDLDPAADFPPDPVAVGFDNIAEVLTLSPVQFELYERAADTLLAAVHDAAYADVRDQIFVCDVSEDGCATDIVRGFAERAWRRPLEDEEVDALLGRVDATLAAGGTRAEGVELALKHALLSVHFLFRVELDPNPGSSAPHLVGDFELASRLSYFLWSTMPDDELFAVARAGKLQDAEEIEAQVRRMLDDPRADALVDNFAGQWLSLRGVAALGKDATVFPEFDAGLADAMATEGELYFRLFLDGERPLDELLTADETFLNGRLAAHYGIEGPTSAAFERTPLGDAKRKGLLTQAGLMSMLAHEAKTSPTVRGAWVLSQILCTPPAAPPGDAPDLEEGGEGATVREQLEEHRKNPACAGCHAAMDPIGLAFEKYDATGKYRLADDGNIIDPSGVMPDGSAFADALELIDILASDADAVSRCVAQQLMTYAVGRPIAGTEDGGHVAQALERLAAADRQLPELVVAVALSGAFRARRGEP